MTIQQEITQITEQMDKLKDEIRKIEDEGGDASEQKQEMKDLSVRLELLKSYPTADDLASGNLPPRAHKPNAIDSRQVEFQDLNPIDVSRFPIFYTDPNTGEVSELPLYKAFNKENQDDNQDTIREYKDSHDDYADMLAAVQGATSWVSALDGLPEDYGWSNSASSFVSIDADKYTTMIGKNNNPDGSISPKEILAHDGADIRVNGVIAVENIDYTVKTIQLAGIKIISSVNFNENYKLETTDKVRFAGFIIAEGSDDLSEIIANFNEDVATVDGEYNDFTDGAATYEADFEAAKKKQTADKSQAEADAAEKAKAEVEKLEELSLSQNETEAKEASKQARVLLKARFIFLGKAAQAGHEVGILASLLLPTVAKAQEVAKTSYDAWKVTSDEHSKYLSRTQKEIEVYFGKVA